MTLKTLKGIFSKLYPKTATSSNSIPCILRFVLGAATLERGKE